MDDATVRIDFFGRCPPAHLTAARHMDKPFVEVSKAQFFAAIGPRDIVTSVVGDANKGYSRFATRQDTEVGRIYSDGRCIEPTRYVLTAAFATKHSAVLEMH
jgi:hypothetical protein